MMTRFLLVFLLVSLLGLLSMFFFASPTGLAEYGVLWKTRIPEQAEQRLEYGVFPHLEKRTIMGYEQRGVSSRKAYLQRQLTPKKAPLQSPSQVMDAWCVKSNGLEGRVFGFDEAARGYGFNCEWFVDVHGRVSDYLLCCDPFTSIDPLPWWRYER